MILLGNFKSSAAAGSTFGGKSYAGSLAGETVAALPNAGRKIDFVTAGQNSSAASTVWLTFRYGQSSGSATSVALMPCGSSFLVGFWDIDVLANFLRMLPEEREWAFESAYRSNSNFRFATDLAETISQLQADMGRVI